MPALGVNTMPADALATQGARASAGMALTAKAGIFCLQHQKIILQQMLQNQQSIIEIMPNMKLFFTCVLKIMFGTINLPIFTK